MQFIDIKEGLAELYRRQNYWILPLFRALCTLLILLMAVTSFTKGMPGGGVLLVLFMAVLASFLPWSVIPIEAAVLLVYCLYKSSLELSLTTAVFFLLVMLVQSVFRGGHAAFIAIVPLAFLWHIPYAVSLIAGLSLGLVAVVPIALGTMSFYFLQMIAGNLGTEAASRDVEEMAGRYGDLFLQYIGNRSMVLMLLAMVLCFLTVFIIRSFAFEYSWYTAVIAGAVLSFLAILLGASLMQTAEISVSSQLLSILCSLLLSIVYILFVHDADYRGTEKLQFEDDSYFYYVKLIPKRRRR